MPEINENEEEKNPNGGPNTIAGKAISSMNARKHGLTGKQIVMPGEDPEEFDALHTALEDEYKPPCLTESILVHDMAKFHWLKDRAIRLQQLAFLTGESMDERRLALMIRYQNANQNAFQKTLKTLQAIQKERRIQEEKESEFDSQPVEPVVFRCSDPSFVYPPEYAKFLAKVDADKAQREKDRAQPKKIA